MVMRKIIIIITLLIIALQVEGQSKYGTYYDQRETLFRSLPHTKNDIIFLGNSITDGGEWCELFDNKNVKNRGISGDVVEGVYDRLPTILKGNPAKIFLLIGVNDVAQGKSAEYIAEGIEKIVNKIKNESPKTKIYIQSILPVNDVFNMFTGHTKRAGVIIRCNELVKSMALKNNITYIDLYPLFINGDGKLKAEYTNDGLHLLGKGYIAWRDIILPYVKK